MIGAINYSIYNNNTKPFDKKCNYYYNQLSCDTVSFQASKRGIMEHSIKKENIIEKINSYKNLEKSPVAYIKPLIEGFLNNKISATEFCNSITKEANFAKYCISKMTQKDIEAMQQTFKDEFQMADNLNNVISKYQGDDKEMIDILHKFYGN